jgi:hypothetical protein
VWNFGGTIPLQITTYNAAGTAQNATAVVLTVTLPDGTTQTPSVTAAGSGVYTATGPATQAGRYTVVWTATGTNADKITDTYDVRPAASTAILSLTDARAALNFSKTTNDPELRDYIDSVTTLIENRIGPVIPRTVTETVTGSQYLYLSQTPVTAVTSITGAQTGAVTILASNTLFDGNTGRVFLADRTGFYSDIYTVVYTAGRGLDPAIMQAARITLQHLWANQRGNAPSRDADAYTAPFSLPNAAREYLDPYIMPAVG